MIEWRYIKHFNPLTDVFSENPDAYADPLLIFRLDAFRDLLGAKVHPSPAPGALARFDVESSGSQHYAVGRKSTAIDVFCECPIAKAWAMALQCKLFGGVGVYFDTVYNGQPFPMLHLDIRDMRDKATVLWYRDGGKYFYPSTREAFLPQLLARLGDEQTNSEALRRV